VSGFHEPVVDAFCGGERRTNGDGAFRWNGMGGVPERARRDCGRRRTVRFRSALSRSTTARSTPCSFSAGPEIGMQCIPFTIEGVNIGRSAAVLGSSQTVALCNSAAVFVD
jgi:hypothetical protein